MRVQRLRRSPFGADDDGHDPHRPHRGGRGADLRAARPKQKKKRKQKIWAAKAALKARATKSEATLTKSHSLNYEVYGPEDMKKLENDVPKEKLKEYMMNPAVSGGDDDVPPSHLVKNTCSPLPPPLSQNLGCRREGK